MSRFVRASKVRHVFGKPAKEDECYKGFRLSSAAGDHNYVKANDKYFAIPVAQANGSLAVMDMAMKERRLRPGVLPTLDGHRGPVLDFDFNPFQTQLIATGGDDCVAKVWGIPVDGMKESISEPLANLIGHDKKVTLITHHPTAEFVIASGSSDRTVKIWDIEAQEEIFSMEHGDLLQGLAWDTTGETLATTSRDKHLRLIDPRTGKERTKVGGHDGVRTAKVTFCPKNGPGKNEVVCSVGFTRQSKRQFKLWDQRDMTKAYAQVNIDQGSGALLPFYDEATKLLFLAGKGDSNIRYYELVEGSPWNFYISEYRSNSPCRGICRVPRRVLDTSKCEITRFLKLHPTKVEPLSMICPRKSDMFQADLYPDTYAGKASISSTQFFKGDKGKIITVSMDPKKAAGSKGPSKAKFTKRKNAGQLQKELDVANARIKDLEALLKKNNIKF